LVHIEHIVAVDYLVDRERNSDEAQNHWRYDTE
jgi:hypothetical protein